MDLGPALVTVPLPSCVLAAWGGTISGCSNPQLVDTVCHDKLANRPSGKLGIQKLVYGDGGQLSEKDISGGAVTKKGQYGPRGPEKSTRAPEEMRGQMLGDGPRCCD